MITCRSSAYHLKVDLSDLSRSLRNLLNSSSVGGGYYVFAEYFKIWEAEVRKMETVDERWEWLSKKQTRDSAEMVSSCLIVSSSFLNSLALLVRRSL